MADTSASVKKELYSWLKRFINVEANEVSAILWSFSYFFSLLCGYYILRPLRDEMGIQGGVENLQWLFTGTFIAMLIFVPLFGWVTSRFSRQRFLPYVYYFFIANLIGFYLLFLSEVSQVYIARAFFIWISVFNLFVISVFWSFMTDIFKDIQAKRLFGFIAAGGTTGAITGPALTTLLAKPLGIENLLLISALCLSWAVFCIHRLIAWHKRNISIENQTRFEEKPIGGGIFRGITLVLQSPYLLGIAMLMLLYTTLSTFLYFEQAQIIRDSFSDPETRTAVFAAIDLAVNTLTILIQMFLLSRLVKWLNLSWTLALIPLLLIIGFIALGIAPTLTILIIVQVIRRAGNYAIMRPAREMLYVVLPREEKYKAKNVNDTVVYRGGDAVSAWAYAGLREIGFNLPQIAWIAVPLTAIWAWLSYSLGKQQARKAEIQNREQQP